MRIDDTDIPCDVNQIDVALGAFESLPNDETAQDLHIATSEVAMMAFMAMRLSPRRDRLTRVDEMLDAPPPLSPDIADICNRLHAAHKALINTPLPTEITKSYADRILFHIQALEAKNTDNHKMLDYLFEGKAAA